MKKRTLLSFSLVGYLLLSNPTVGTTQDVVWLADKLPTASQPVQRQQVSLESALRALEQKFGIKFSYANKIVAGKKIVKLSENTDESLTKTLDQILLPLGLKYEQVTKGTIFILEKKEMKKVDKLEVNSSSVPQLSWMNLNDIPLSQTTLQYNLEKTVSGTITDLSNNEPIPGVNILVKGSAAGTVSGIDGTYRLEVPDNDAVLIFSSVGYLSKEIEVGNQTVIDMQLNPDLQQLEEIVVVGYGTQEKSKLVGSVSQVNSQAVNDRPVPQLRQALTGQMAGVTITQNSGQPGNQGGAIQIRGVSSINSSNAPLILVDGIPTSSFNDIDPNVVENISVLKDASSAAIYGARAANGVILVTTKTANSDQLQVVYNGYAGVQVPTEYPEYVNSWEYAELLNESNANDDLPPAYSAEEIELFRNGNDPDNYPNSDFIGRVLKRQAAQTGHNITIANGVGSSNYLLSVGYLYQNGIIDENNYNRYNLRLNVVSEITDKLKLTSRLAGVQVYDEQPSGPATLGNANSMLGIIGQAVRYPSIYPIRLSNGDWGGGFEQSGTPASFLASESFYKQRSTDLFLNMQLDWNILPDLQFSLIGGYTYFDNKWERFSASQQITPANVLGPADLRTNTAGRYYRTLQQLLTYNKIVGDHEFSILVGHTFRNRTF